MNEKHKFKKTTLFFYQTFNKSKNNMKKNLLSFILLAFTIIAIKAQIVNIPDASFKNCLLTNPAINTNNDNEIQLIEAQAFSGIIDCSWLNISDLTGIEAFIALTELYCSNNNLTSLDVSANTALTKLWCNYNQLTSLNLGGNSILVNLQCGQNQLSILNVSASPALAVLNCSGNQLSSLDVSYNSELKDLLCSANLMTTIDLSSNLKLEQFQCNLSLLTELDVSHNPLLSFLVIDNSQLTSLNIANGNNANFNFFFAQNNPALECIQVDDEQYCNANWTGGLFQKDSTAVWAEDCNSTVSLSDMISNEMLFFVYPNPTTNMITFSVPAHVSLTTLSGQKITDRENITELDLSDQPSGLYILNVIDDSGRMLQRHKIVKH